MKKFNKSIKVEVSVDSIADKLLSMFSNDEKHSELVTETIIGNMLKDNTSISQLYNAVNGYTNEIDFKVGDVINCSDTFYTYVLNGETIGRRSIVIGTAVVKEIDIYSNNKLLIEIETITSDGNPTVETKNVHHTDCSKIEPVKVIGKIDLTK